MSQELSENNYFNTSTTINQNEKSVKAFNSKDESTLSISTNTITQYVNNANMLRFLRLETKLAIAKF